MIKGFRALGAVLVCTVWPCAVAAQPIESVGSRAAGMGGAFVAVADDASAVYWNPAGLASGAFFSLLLDRSTATFEPDEDPVEGSSRSGAIIALSTPPLGLSYYRLRETATYAPPITAQPDILAVDTLVTHHVGVTLVHSIVERVAVGATLKLVRGSAASGLAVGATREELLDHDDLIGRDSTTGDVDLGVMLSLGVLRAGVTVRNLTEPDFETEGGTELTLNRQARAGIAFAALQNWLVALDVDLIRQESPLGDLRNLATGVEGRLHPRATVRGGVRFNTVGDTNRGPAFSGGGSFGVFASMFVDAHITGGSDDSERGWGVAARILF